MSVLEFVASLVRSLAWPVAVFGVAFLLRAQLRQLLDQVTHGRLRGLGFEAEWDREVAKVESGVSLAPTEPVAGRTEIPMPTIVTAADPVSAIVDIYDTLDSIARPRLARSDEERQMPLHRLAALAAERGDIHPGTAEALEGLVMLRNLAEHGSGETTQEKVREYQTIAAAVLYGLDAKREGRLLIDPQDYAGDLPLPSKDDGP